MKTAIAIVLSAASFASPAAAGDFFNAPEPQVITPGAIPFQEYTAEIGWASLWGGDEGQHGGFTRFAADFITPPHKHSHPYHAVVLKGTVINPFEGGEALEMGPGSYWYVPAGMVHTTGCVSEEPCEFYYHSDHTDDFIAVE